MPSKRRGSLHGFRARSRCIRLPKHSFAGARCGTWKKGAWSFSAGRDGRKSGDVSDELTDQALRAKKGSPHPALSRGERGWLTPVPKALGIMGFRGHENLLENVPLRRGGGEPEITIALSS